MPFAMMKQALPAFLLAALLLLPSLAIRPLWMPDETRYADVALNMLTDDGAIVPKLNGRIYREKPPFFFWSIAGLVTAGVPVNVAPRLISILASLLTLLLVPVIGSRMGVAAPICRRATFMLATTPFFLLYGTMGLLDPLFAFLITAAMAAKLARAGAGGGRRALFAVLEGLFLGAAMLTKGPVCLLFPLGLRLGAIFSGAGRAGRADRSDLLALTVALAGVFAWLVAAARVAGVDYVLDLTLGQIARRVAGEVPHHRPRYFLPLLTFVGFIPWALFGVNGLWRALRARSFAPMPSATAAVAGWVIFPLVVFTILPSQQPHYVLPLLPAGGLLLAYAVEGSATGVARIFGYLASVMGGFLLAGWPAVRFVLPTSLVRTPVRALLEADWGLHLVGAGAGLALLLFGVRLVRRAGEAEVWKPTVALVSLFFAGTILVTWQVGPLIAPTALMESRAVAGASSLAASESLRSAVRIGTGRREVGSVDKYHILEKLQRRPGLVVVVWEKNLRWMATKGLPVDALRVRERAWVRGRAIVAVGLAPP